MRFGCGFRVDCTPDYIATPVNEMSRNVEYLGTAVYFASPYTTPAVTADQHQQLTAEQPPLPLARTHRTANPFLDPRYG